jgi:hypothetical protein
MFGCYEVVLAILHKDNDNGNICLDNASTSNYWLPLFFVESVARAPCALFGGFGSQICGMRNSRRLFGPISFAPTKQRISPGLTRENL